ncbi:hypothetical protein [Sphingosinicella terrae]|nr:hypothetical protein [Sphingosinicella terrae]
MNGGWTVGSDRLPALAWLATRAVGPSAIAGPTRASSILFRWDMM